MPPKSPDFRLDRPTTPEPSVIGQDTSQTVSSSVSRLRERLQSLKQERSRLEGKLQTARRAKNNAQKEVGRLKQRVDTLQRKVEQARQEVPEEQKRKWVRAGVQLVLQKLRSAGLLPNG